MKKIIYMLGIAAIIGLSGCGSDAVEEETNHSGSAEVPEGLKEAENPAFKIGSQAIIQDGHMEGMKGAEATISGAYDTTVYAMSYTPTTGSERVANHKWIIHEEVKGAGEQPIEPGTEVTLDTDHLEGMKGAKAAIESDEQTTVYMVDYTPTNGGEKVTNHKWVTESELSAK
ncbi:YdhK family protein [Domibacillus sp. PGB-M46]|uniref:YdhK family protein n=1 Tax=Domibacillus sp. PGB-M46 TaxID=2910255 RepID=UPI001F5728E7|nr:YdhK family protein [Domibacillus sp. PGB-M46]MCI2256619.1 YdhK family protein [Domibacillus sp. PGB-M46]